MQVSFHFSSFVVSFSGRKKKKKKKKRNSTRTTTKLNTTQRMTVAFEKDVGVHCAFESCHQLDFLIWKCDLCARSHCAEHQSPESHLCAEIARRDLLAKRAAVCDKCHVPFNPDAAAAPHRCATVATKHFCSHRGCRASGPVAELSKVTCKHCAKTYCIEHRFDCKHPARARVPTPPCAADVKRQLQLDAALARAIAASQN
jgi:hypothetical protein